MRKIHWDGGREAILEQAAILLEAVARGGILGRRERGDKRRRVGGGWEAHSLGDSKHQPSIWRTVSVMSGTKIVTKMLTRYFFCIFLYYSYIFVRFGEIWHQKS